MWIYPRFAGGPSQLETFDPKPDAPSYIRGPLRPISTAVPGTSFSEGFPRLAERADRLAVIRSLNHTAAPIHETGLQLLSSRPGSIEGSGAGLDAFVLEQDGMSLLPSL